MERRRQITRLYHLAEEPNLPSILDHGLMSTQDLLAFTGVPQALHADWLRAHRPSLTRLSAAVLVRDQRPMPPHLLAPALDGGLTPEDWYAYLNGFVFLWPDRNRLERQWRACGGRPQVLLTLDAEKLFAHFADDVFVSPINSGNARRAPARRGRDTFAPYPLWRRDGWPTGNRRRPPAEVLVARPVPLAPFLIECLRV